jgi:hypothetical protein
MPVRPHRTGIVESRLSPFTQAPINSPSVLLVQAVALSLNWE